MLAVANRGDQPHDNARCERPFPTAEQPLRCSGRPDDAARVSIKQFGNRGSANEEKAWWVL
jgi:hypothetical protein